jgi:hypothetical protein
VEKLALKYFQKSRLHICKLLNLSGNIATVKNCQKELFTKPIIHILAQVRQNFLLLRFLAADLCRDAWGCLPT